MNSGEQNSKPDLYVIARIIKALREKNRMNKTALATTTGLAYDKLVKYLGWMQEKGFIVYDDNGLVVLTPVGSEAYNDLVQWIMKYVGQLKFPRLKVRT
ncbi:MAG TPA: winged helix-turn-helix domain-containing protein [Candidatus Acidoferrales bacterium]|nr:winged helix-turn-helix domain-containing protein [Candidatus Acidoferrales bacterium]